MFRDTREQTKEVWCLQLKNSSIITPRYFIHCFRSNELEKPSVFIMSRFIGISFFCGFDYDEVCFTPIDKQLVNIAPSFHFG